VRQQPLGGSVHYLHPFLPWWVPTVGWRWGSARRAGTTVVGRGAMLLVLDPVCRWYLGVKRRHPQSALRFG
jgi:hypothetical protein